MAERIIPPLPTETLDKARCLRQTMTDAEQALWYHLRAGRFGGFKFRRQHPLPPYVVDFVCLSQWLVVELDGSQHSPSVDAERDRSLERAGFRLLRFWNDDVLIQTEAVLAQIWSALHDRTLSPTPLPWGEGLSRESQP
ncbi:MAG: endonuclease domain-containing protein [Burkholderiales bacterium]|jgi:very-short-patch-repair endonuclease